MSEPHVRRPSPTAKALASAAASTAAVATASGSTGASSRPPSDQGDPRPRHLRPVWIVLLFLIPCLALTGYYYLYGVSNEAADGSFVPSTSYAFVLLLLNLDLIGLVVLTLLLSRNLIKAYFERRHRLAGSGFRTKLVAAFIGFSLIPTLLLAFVASRVVDKAVDVWFSDQIDRVMKDSFEVAKMHHTGHITLATNSARAVSQEIYREDLMAPAQRDLLIAAMARERADHNVAGVEIYSSKMEMLTKALAQDVPMQVLDMPIGQLVLQVITTKQELTSVQEAEKGRLIRAGVPILSAVRPGEVEGVVVVDAYVPESLLAKMEGIGQRYAEYKQIKAMKNPIKAGAYLFVATVTVMILFGATWFGFYVARSITVPIQRLAEATEAIAQGDLNVHIQARATDEIGTLIESFNRMTADLRTSKAEIESANDSLRQSNVEIERRRAYTQTVVDTIAAGLLSIDRQGVITTFNPSAERILGIWADRIHGRSANEVFKEHKLDLFQTVYDRMLADRRDTLSLEGQLEMQGRLLTMGVSCSRMQEEGGRDLGYVLIFEDLTELIKAQKASAWQEVAKRVAHEIKNPLTPIQLSAQRLRKKYFEQAPDFDKIFDEATQTIVNEVGSLKSMVDEFSKFARLPTPQLVMGSLNDVLREVVTLYQNAHRDVEIIAELDDVLPNLKFDREQIKRVLVNLCDNGIQAMNQKGRLWVTSKFDGRRRRAIVTVADEGSGISAEDQEKLFVPYFSRKRTGTGLGLAISRRVINDHEGQITAANNQPKGAVFTFELPV